MLDKWRLSTDSANRHFCCFFYMKELGKPSLFFHDSLWAYRSAIPWSAHGSYMKHRPKYCNHRVSFFVAARSKYHAPAMPVYTKDVWLYKQ